MLPINKTDVTVYSGILVGLPQLFLIASLLSTSTIWSSILKLFFTVDINKKMSRGLIYCKDSQFLKLQIQSINEYLI